MLFGFSKKITGPGILLAIILFIWSGQLVFSRTYETYVATNASKLEFLGAYAGGQMGAQIATGDLNRDGSDDLIVSSPFASIDEKKWNGAVTIIFGGDGSENENIYLYGDNSGDQLGTALTVADLNRDGVEDLAVSASIESDSLTETEESGRLGKVYLIDGKRFLDSQTDSRASSHYVSRWTDTYFTGKRAGDLYGLNLESGDIDQDGRMDLIIAAPLATVGNVTNMGAVYVYLGSREGVDPYHDFVFTGQNISERFGNSVKSGDFNGNGRLDFAIGAPQAHSDELSQTGKVYLYYDFVDKKDSPIRVPDITLNGEYEKQWFGFSLDIGNLNGDGYDDLIASAFPFNGDSGTSYIKAYYGQNLEKGTGNADILIKNPLPQFTLGSKVSLEDLNKDNKADIIMGAAGIGANDQSDVSGNVYVIYSDEEEYVPIYSIADLEVESLIHGETPDDWFGYNFNTLDFNGDGFGDLAVSARYADGDDGVNNGKIYAFYGDGQPFGRVKAVIEESSKEVSRGEFVRIILTGFDLKIKKAAYLENCLEYREFCLFNFMAMSSFDGIMLEPELVLYPDVDPSHEYYEDINTATMLGMITGYLDERSSPFNPDRPISRIQALKIVLAAADLVPSKYQFELVNMFGSYLNLTNQSSYFVDVDSHIKHMWWYPRYTNYAVEHDIIDKSEYFRPDDNITPQELNDMVVRTLDSIK